ncbi:ParB N-terminal domain-containing protein [Streptacidiphilus sp. MAP5-3]|uniref:ParB N-terminal domain-containing protein n=1 Tax=unclassified Streptacidiphilus TaxID=2643834 RepID=UPI0035184DE8
MSATTVEAQAGIQVTPAPWPTIAVAELLAHPGNVRETEMPAELLASIEAEGIAEPLYIVRGSAEAPQIIDGFERLAAASALGLESVPYTPRPVIRIDALTPHPKNVRDELDFEELVPSLQEFGCRDLIKIQRMPDGVIQVNDGNRRLFAAPLAGLTHLPYEWDEEQDEAGQILGMITSAQHRRGLTQAETMAAMFTAAEAGADVRSIATAAGVKRRDVKALVKSRSDATLKQSLEASSYAWTFEQLAALGEFADDPDAVAAITAAADNYRPESSIEWQISIQRAKRETREQAEAHRAELQEAGQQIRERPELSDRATPVWRLRTTEGERIGPQEHAGCKGQIWVLDSDDDSKLTPYCSAPVLYGHAEPGTATGKVSGDEDQEAEKKARAAVKVGNLHWDAAETRRRRWISDLIKRRTLPKDTATALTGHISTALLDGTWDVGGSLNSDRTTEILAALLGLPPKQHAHRSGFTDQVSKDPRRAVQLQFAAIAAVRERSAGRYAWRTDHMRCAEIRRPTAKWLTILEALGYTPSPVERAVMDDVAYDPDARPQFTDDAEPEADDDGQGDDAEAAA